MLLSTGAIYNFCCIFLLLFKQPLKKKRARSRFHLWAIEAYPWPNNRQKIDRNQAMCFNVLSKRTFKQESTLE